MRSQLVLTHRDPRGVLFLRHPVEGVTSLTVPARDRRGTEVRGCQYQLKIHYGTAGKYRYSKSAPFEVRETAYSADRVTITISASYGNMSERSISEGEFNGGN